MGDLGLSVEVDPAKRNAVSQLPVNSKAVNENHWNYSCSPCVQSFSKQTDDGYLRDADDWACVLQEQALQKIG